MIENTTGDLFPEVPLQPFTVSQIPAKKYFDSGQAYYHFQFKTQKDGEEALYEEKFAIWLCAPLFRALGCKEVKPGHFDVEVTELLGKTIMARIQHETVKKGKAAGKVVPRMVDIQDEVPF